MALPKSILECSKRDPAELASEHGLGDLVTCSDASISRVDRRGKWGWDVPNEES